MHGMHAILLASLLASPALAAALPEPPVLPAAPEPLPLRLQVPDSPAELVIGVPALLPLAVSSPGVAGAGLQPPVERKVHLNASLDTGEAIAVEPNPVVLPPGAGEAQASLRFTPGRLGPLGIHLDAVWELLPGNATLDAQRTIIKDSLALEGLDAGPPDADLDLVLNATLRSGHLAAEPLNWRVEAAHTPANGTEPLTWVAAAGSGKASPSGEPWDAKVRARYGAGRYTFTLHAGGARLDDANASVAVQVAEVRRDAASVNFTLDVEDHPTTLRLASDSVNSDGKAKTPGNAVITRVVVGDQNGLADVQRVTFSYQRNTSSGLVLVASRVVEQLGGGTERTLEDRFELSPMKDADYICVVTAEGTGSPSVQRTFIILDVQPEASLALANASFWPAQAGSVEGTLAVRDANFGTGPLDGSDVTELETLALMLYKGSTRVSEPGWGVRAGDEEGPAPLTLDLRGQGARSSTWPYSVVNAKGQLSVPVAVTIPEAASPGSYRLSAQSNGTTIASAPFEVQALPRVARFALVGSAAPGEALAFTAELSPAQGLAAAELRTPWGATLRAQLQELEPIDGGLRWNGTLTLPRPLDDEVARNATMVADLGDGRVLQDPLGRVVNARTAPLLVANAPPGLEASLHLGGVLVGDEAWVHPHASLELAARARAHDDNAEEPSLRDELRPLEAEVRDWKGGLGDFEVDGDFAPAGAELLVQPLGVEPGRYTLTLRARDDDGAVAARELAVHVGTHFKLVLSAPAGGLRFERQPDGSLAAELLVRNKGNAAAGSLALLAEGLPAGARAEATLALPNGTLLASPLEGGFARFEAPRLVQPSEWARLRLLVDAAAGVPAGTFAGRLVVAGEAP